MASYAAVCSLQNTILRRPNSSTISIPPSTLVILRPAYKGASSLKEYLNKLGSSSGERVNAMNAQIREAACKLEDAILSHVSDQFILKNEDQINIGASEKISPGLREVKQEVCSFVEMAKRIMEENRIEDLLAEEEDNISLTTDFGRKCSKIVGFSDLFSKVKHKLTDMSFEYILPVGLVGMAGSGKTTLAMKIFEDPEF